LYLGGCEWLIRGDLQPFIKTLRESGKDFGCVADLDLQITKSGTDPTQIPNSQEELSSSKVNAETNFFLFKPNDPKNQVFFKDLWSEVANKDLADFSTINLMFQG
jgi:hypothetical protein